MLAASDAQWPEKPVTQSLPDGQVFSAITFERLTGCLKKEKLAGRPMTRAGELPAKMCFTGGWRTAFFLAKQTFGRIMKMRLIDAESSQKTEEVFKANA